MPAEVWTSMGLRARVVFSLTAEAQPGFLPRLLAPFARRDLSPDRLEARRIDQSMHVEVWLDSMPAEMVPLVEGNLRQIVGVRALRVLREVSGSVSRAAAA